MKLITRRLARICTLQALYSWQISKNNILDIEHYIIISQKIQNLNISYFHALYSGIVKSILELNKLMMPYVLRDVRKLDYIEYSVLLIALFELTKCCDVPYKVVINEAIELSKIFGSEKSHKFINGVLDKAALGILYNKSNN